MANKITIGGILTLIIFFILVMGFASAQIGKYQTTYDIKRPCINNGTYCSSSTACNITISYPDATILVNNKQMTNQLSFHNYTLTNTTINQLGEYEATMMCNDGGLYGSDTFTFEITGNGNANATSGVIVLFSVLFLILVGVTCYLAMYSIGHLMALDFDLVDLAFDWGLFFVILVTYMLEKFYLGNIQMETYLIWFISVGGILLILVPTISFVLSITIGSLSRKRMIAMNAPARMKLRRGR